MSHLRVLSLAVAVIATTSFGFVPPVHAGGPHGGGAHGGWGYHGGYYPYYHPYPYGYGLFFGLGYPYPYYGPYLGGPYSYGPADLVPVAPVFVPATVVTAPGSVGIQGPVASEAPSADVTAHIQVRAPAEAEIWFGDHKTPGTVREFISPPLPPGQEFVYEVRAR